MLDAILFVGGVVACVAFIGALWLLVLLLIDVYDWVFGAIEAAWRKEHGK